ncbi:MAG TPA: DinB family protein [Flavobacterium sp.]|nr:DinB family protein [Flavobacterium sp.]
MEQTVNKLQNLLTAAEAYFAKADDAFLQLPIAEGKWSRKQILGHLIDSAVNNLTRFTEIGYQPQPYIYREYRQNELVEINRYQTADAKEIFRLWLSLNKQIVRVIQSQTEERLHLKVQFTDGMIADLRFIMTDYPEHLEHHLNQIFQ